MGEKTSAQIARLCFDENEFKIWEQRNIIQ